MHGDLRSRGLAVSKDLLHALLDHLQDAHLLFAIPVGSDQVTAWREPRGTTAGLGKLEAVMLSVSG
jgi:hypothetical protein